MCIVDIPSKHLSKKKLPFMLTSVWFWTYYDQQNHLYTKEREKKRRLNIPSKFLSPPLTPPPCPRHNHLHCSLFDLIVDYNHFPPPPLSFLISPSTTTAPQPSLADHLHASLFFLTSSLATTKLLSTFDLIATPFLDSPFGPLLGLGLFERREPFFLYQF